MKKIATQIRSMIKKRDQFIITVTEGYLPIAPVATIVASNWNPAP